MALSDPFRRFSAPAVGMYTANDPSALVSARQSALAAVRGAVGGLDPETLKSGGRGLGPGQPHDLNQVVHRQVGFGRIAALHSYPATLYKIDYETRYLYC